MDYELQEEEDAAALGQAVRKGISDADHTDAGPRDWQPIAISLRSTEGKIVGGVYGATMWSWLMIDGLWVDASLRGRGLGSRLLLRSEAMAVARGCRGSWLGTFDFQARGFYERHGYTVFATLPGFPPGHTHFHLRKDLVLQTHSAGT
jgi:GNAT superfamily N-acetyltransferase